MKLFDFFKPKPQKELFPGYRFYYHEDDFCRVEMRPAENFGELKEDLKQIQNIKNNNSSDYGYSKIHIIEEGEVKMIDRKIKTVDLEPIMKSTGLKKFDNITTGYGSQEHDSEYSVGFGGHRCAILYERNQQLVDHIWFDYSPYADNSAEIQALIKYILEISNRWNLMLVDWNLAVMVESKNEEILKKYLDGEFEN